MTARTSNSEFLIVEPPLPIDASGWEVRVISPHDWTTIIGYVRNWRKMSGSRSLNDAGSGSIELNTTNPILSTPFPGGLDGDIRGGEFLWQFWRDGVLRHEWISDDEQENEVGESYDSIITFAGRTPEKVLSWAIHQPVWGERQAYDLTGEPDGGTYKLVLRGELTVPIAWNATPATVQAALEALSPITPGDITVRMSTENPWRYIIQFQGKLTGKNIPRIQAKSILLTKTGGDPAHPPGLDIPEASDDDSWTDLNSTILGQPAIASVLAHLERAQSRGVLPFLDITFDATHDSSGAPWTDVTDVTISPGEDLMALLQRLSDMLQWEFRVLPGFQLWIVQDTYGSRKENEVVFYKSGHQLTHERSSSSRDVITDVFTQSSKFEITHNSTTSDVTPWKREAWIEAGGSPTTSSASQVGFATLAVRKDKKVSRTVKVPAELPTRSIFIDYDLSDWIMLETQAGMEPVKVVGVSFSCDPGAEFGLEIVIQSTFEAREAQLQRALHKMGSKASTGGKGSSPTGSAPISRAVSLKDLSDVNLGGVLEGDILVRDGNGWTVQEPNINFLTDVDTESAPPVDGQSLVYDITSDKWMPGSPAAGEVTWTSVTGKPSTFAPIIGTTGITAKAGNWFPTYAEVTGKPSTFEPVVKDINWLSDVNTATVAPTDGQTLVWNASTSQWKPGTIAAGSAALSGLTDVTITSPANGQALVYDSASSKWKNVATSSHAVGADLIQTGSYNPRVTGLGSGTNPAFQVDIPAANTSTAPAVRINHGASSGNPEGFVTDMRTTAPLLRLRNYQATSAQSEDAFQVLASGETKINARGNASSAAFTVSYRQDVLGNMFEILGNGTITRMNGYAISFAGGGTSAPSGGNSLRVGLQIGDNISVPARVYAKTWQPFGNDGWAAVTASTGYTTKTANYALGQEDELTIFNGSSLQATLPDPSLDLNKGRIYVIKNIHSTNLTVVTAGTAKTIDGATSQIMAQWDNIRVASDGTQWLIIESRKAGPTGSTGATGAPGVYTGPQITASTTAPLSPAVGDVWIDTSP